MENGVDINIFVLFFDFFLIVVFCKFYRVKFILLCVNLCFMFFLIYGYVYCVIELYLWIIYRLGSVYLKFRIYYFLCEDFYDFFFFLISEVGESVICDLFCIID